MKKNLFVAAVCLAGVLPAALLPARTGANTEKENFMAENISASVTSAGEVSAADSLPAGKQIVIQPEDSVLLKAALEMRAAAASRPVMKSRHNPPPATSIRVGRAYMSLTPEELVKTVFLNIDEATTCFSDGLVSNVKLRSLGWKAATNSWDGAERGLAYFDNGAVAFKTSIDTVAGGAVMDQGILLGTGNVLDAEGPNEANAAMSNPYLLASTYDTDFSQDVDLRSLLSSDQGYIKNGSILEFDFIPYQDQMSFQYSFASEEYSEYSNSQYNDIFGFFVWEVNPVTGAQVGEKTNIARLPYTRTGDYTVKINNVNWGYRYYNYANTWTVNPPYIEGTIAQYTNWNNNGFPSSSYPTVAFNPQYFTPIYQEDALTPSASRVTPMEFDGRTLILTAKHDVQPGHKYHLKLAVANLSDQQFGSGVFLKAGSFDIGKDITNYGNGIKDMNHVFEGCTNNRLDITVNPSTSARMYNIEWTGAGLGSIAPAAGGALPTSIIVPANEITYSIPYRVLNNAPEYGDITLNVYIPGCPASPTHLTITSHKKFTAQIQTTPDCNTGDRGTATVAVTNGFHPQMELDNSGSWRSITQPFTGLVAGSSHTIRVRDSISCVYGEPFAFTITNCYDVRPENVTVQEYQDIVIDVLANDILPASATSSSSFNLLNQVTQQPTAGKLSVVGSGANSKLVYHNYGAASLTNGIDMFKYNFTVTAQGVTQTLTATVYIYVLKDNNGATACMSNNYTISLDNTKPSGVQFNWSSASGAPQEQNTPTKMVYVTDTISFLVEPVVPNTSLYNNMPFQKGRFTVWLGNKPGMGEMIWTGTFNNDWNNPRNWVQKSGSGTVPVQWQPSKCVNVTIQASVDYFPELTGPAYCADITMKDRAMLKNPHVLDYNNASVEIKLKPETEMDRFVMWSAPLSEMYSGDYHYNAGTSSAPVFGDVFINLFQQANPDYAGSIAQGNYFTATEATTSTTLPLGRAFNLKVTATDVTKTAALQFPKTNTVYPNMSTSLVRTSLGRKFITHGVSLNAAKRFSLPVHGNMNLANTRLVQIVNPYMAFLRIDSFLINNPQFQSGYYIWNGTLNNGFNVMSSMSGYNRIVIAASPTMTSAVGDNLYIPPLQSFFVAKSTPTANLTSVLMSPNWTTTSAPIKNMLRAQQVSSGGMLNIKATQGNNEAYAALVYTPGATSFIDKDDMPAIEYADLPLSVYTISSNEPLAINHNDNFGLSPVALGIRTKAAGTLTLDFAGISTFGHKVVLTDKVLKKDIDLNSTPQYTFSVAKQGSSSLEINDRFSLSLTFTGKGIGTDNEDVPAETPDLQIFSTGRSIDVKADALPVKGVIVYNTAGAVVHSATGINSFRTNIFVPSQQLYIVKAWTERGERTEKVFVR
ncbi:MAG: choice-of-anchor L domain-containing protein [Tannerellaceae bacterium]|nr:choice-of-anchor L domain-containing protein [Tannerellaceae bacterium]